MTHETNDFYAEQIRRMSEKAQPERDAIAGQIFWLPDGHERWTTYMAGAVIAAILAAGVWLFAVELPASTEKWHIITEQQQATYDRYMSQCLQDHREYECVKMLGEFRP